MPTRPAVTVKGRRGRVKEKKGDGRAGSVGIAIVVDDPKLAQLNCKVRGQKVSAVHNNAFKRVMVDGD